MSSETIIQAVLVVFFLLLVTITVIVCAVLRTKRQLHAARAQQRIRLESSAASPTGEQTRLRLIRQGIEILMANQCVKEGIPLASTLGVVEVLADRDMRLLSGRSHSVTTADGRRATITDAVEMSRANGPTPEATAGPTLVELLTALVHQRRRSSQGESTGSDPYSNPVEELIEQLVQSEVVERANDVMQDADEVYGMGFEYSQNPDNKGIHYTAHMFDEDPFLFSPR